MGRRGGGSGERAWRNLRILDGRLWYRSPTQWWVRTSLRLDPEALVVVGRDHVEVGRLPWARGLTEPSDDPHNWERAGWWLWGVPGSRVNRAGIRINARDDDAIAALGGRQQLWLPSTLRPPPLVDLPASPDTWPPSPRRVPALAIHIGSGPCSLDSPRARGAHRDRQGNR